MERILEKVVMWIAWKMPRSIARWCFIRVATNECAGNPGERTCFEAVEAWK